MKFEAILFDCDGVLVDSEPLTLGVLRDMLAERGWAMPLDECIALFLGRQVRSQRALIEARTGQPLTDAWMDAFYARRNEALRTRLQAMPGAVQAARAAYDLCNGRIACASGADREKVELQLAKVDLLAAGVTEDQLKEIDKTIRARVSEAADFAEKSPLPEAHELYTDVLVGEY